MVRPAAGLAILASLAFGALAISSCGNADLWARYRAERDFWRARRLVGRIEVNPRVAAGADYQSAAAAFRRIAAQFPAAKWTDAEHLRRPLARDVAILSGQAAIAAARIEEARGNVDGALEGYRRAGTEYRAIRSVALEATLARASALERADRREEMIAAYAEVTREFPLVDPGSGAALPLVLDAPLRIAREQSQQGRNEAADSTLSAAEAREVVAVREQHGRPAAVDLWRHLARVRMEMRRLDGARTALRGVLSEPGAASAAPGTVLTLAEYSIAGGQPDSAFAYTAWAERAFDDSTRARAMTLTARAWERRGPADSAVAAWGRVLEAYPTGGGYFARFQRGRLLEQLGRWEFARSEYRALIAADPTNELSFAALSRIVSWHAAHGEKELARIEGRRGIESLDNLIATNRDEHILEMARRTRADLLLDIEDWNPACTALSDLWNRYGDTESGFRAADVAEARLRDTTRAVRLYRDLASRASGDAERRSAQDAVERLERSRG